ncbi:MAG: hypothetical protein IPK79_01005 [Vampirovibrionales bacterium]|nr:hypothetical protein [Vampirovibrionales bacterium]
MLHTTFELLREHEACKEGYAKLAKSLGGVRKHGANKPVPLTAVLDSNGLEDALWCLRATIEPADSFSRHLACDFADAVRHLMTDDRSRNAIDVARRHADGNATDDELRAAWAAAWAAARAAAWAAAGARVGAAAGWGAAAGDARARMFRDRLMAHEVSA